MKEVVKSRDIRLDAIRGLLLVIMAAVHVPTPISHAIQEPFGFMSEAEGFIFLSACLAGFAYGRTCLQSGWRTMAGRILTRTRKIYFIHLAVVLPLVLVAWLFASRVTPLANHFHDFLVHPWGALVLIPLLLHQPPLLDILPLYIIFLAVTPWLLAIARRKGWGIILSLSFLGWLAVQLNICAHIVGNPAQWLPVRWGAFNLLAWQFVWVSGLAFGETALHRPLLPDKWRPAVGIPCAVIVLTGLLARHGFVPFNPDLFLWMDKWTLGPLRLLNFAAWVGLLLAWKPQVPSAPLKPLALLGRNSLAVFSFHLPLVVIATTMIQMFALSSVGQVLAGLMVMTALFPWAVWVDGRPSQVRLPAASGEPWPPIWMRNLPEILSREIHAGSILAKIRARLGTARA